MVPDLPGLLVLGDSREDVIAQAPDVISDYIDALREDGTPVPERHTMAIDVTVTT